MLANDAFHIAVLPGDDIGPEVMVPALKVLKKIAATTPTLKFRFTEAAAGANHYKEPGKSMPDSTVKLCEQADAIFLGACGLPSVRYPDNTEIMPQVELRFIFDLYAGVRPCRLIPGVPSPIVGAAERGMDLVVIRESTEGLFASMGKGVVTHEEARETWSSPARPRSGCSISRSATRSAASRVARTRGASPASTRRTYSMPTPSSARCSTIAPSAIRRSRPKRRARSAAQLPLLRQPEEVFAVRQHVQRKVGGRQPGRAGARQRPSPSAGDARFRRRRWRRHRAAANHARDARPLPAHVVLRGRQGDQPRGRANRAAEDVGPLLRTSSDGAGAGADQSRLCRCAFARGQIAERRVQHSLARGAADWKLRAPVRAADHRPDAVLRAELEGRREPEDRQSGLRPTGRAGDLSPGPQVPARPDHPEARRHRRQLRPGDRLAAVSRAPRSTSRPSA